MLVSEKNTEQGDKCHLQATRSQGTREVSYCLLLLVAAWSGFLSHEGLFRISEIRKPSLFIRRLFVLQRTEPPDVSRQNYGATWPPTRFADRQLNRKLLTLNDSSFKIRVSHHMRTYDM